MNIYQQLKSCIRWNSKHEPPTLLLCLIYLTLRAPIHFPVIDYLIQVDIIIIINIFFFTFSFGLNISAMRDLAIQTADAFILVYAVDDQESLDEVCRLKETILKVRGDNVPPLVVVANKIGNIHIQEK